MSYRQGQIIRELRSGRERRLRLGSLIKSGGAGSVFHIEGQSGEVVKLYHASTSITAYARKIRAMLALSPQVPDPASGFESIVQLAWPLAEAVDRDGGFLGFVMPELDVKATLELEYMLQERQARAAGLPVGLGARITLAANLAALIASLHQQQHYVVDMKPLNLRFYRDSLYLSMLDCDGFSIQGNGERFAADQFTIDYLAPEFQREGRIPQGQEEYQDRFALAVILFQLLNFGIHPYSGRPGNDRVPTDLPGRIRGHYYAYGNSPHRDMAPNPSSGHKQMPGELRQLFDRAFGNRAYERPGPGEWARALNDYARPSTGKLRVCKKNREHQHYAGQPCAACIRDGMISQARKGLKPRVRVKARTQKPHPQGQSQRRPQPQPIYQIPQTQYSPPTGQRQSQKPFTPPAFVVRFLLFFFLLWVWAILSL